jgi:hypothetical protein
MWSTLRFARSRLLSNGRPSQALRDPFPSTRLVGSIEFRGFASRQNVLDFDSNVPQDYLDDLTYDDDGREEERLRKEEVKEEIAAKKGRGWTDPWDLQEMYESKIDYEQLPDWAPSLVSRISQERVQIHPDKIPTLQTLARLPLPPPPAPHPGHGHAKVYALYRKRAQYKYVLEKVTEMAELRIGPIQDLTNWEEKQDAVDALFEDIEFELKEQEGILGKHPKLGSWVERALEEYLRGVQKAHDEQQATLSTETSETKAKADAVKAETKVASDASSTAFPTLEEDEAAVPVFLDCYSPDDPKDQVVPSILSPLEPHLRASAGRMVEEWELAAHKESKRIMIRQSTRQIARALEESTQARIYVHGREGVGKTSALAAIVASVRTSGSIVLFLPDGDRLRKNGFYVEPNAKRPGIFDLPMLSEKVCREFLAVHKQDLQGFQIDKATIDKFFTEDQQERLKGYSGDSMPLVDLLEFGAEKTSYSPMCYSAAVDVLMNQDEKPFVMVLDEFNCYYEKGHYYHAEYDLEVKTPIPNDHISLFKPAMDAMAISMEGSEDIDTVTAPLMMKRGAIIVATTESHAIPRKVTDGLAACVQRESSNEGAAVPMYFCEIPRLSPVEVEHMLANYEAIGLGKLRLDQGDTVMNEHEVTFLRMVSGGVSQKLMDACIL